MNSDAIALIVTVLIAGGSLIFLLHRLATSDRRREEMTEEEYENRDRTPNLLGAGAMALDQIIRADAKNAIEYQQDAEQGHLPGGDHEGEKNDG